MSHCRMLLVAGWSIGHPPQGLRIRATSLNGREGNVLRHFWGGSRRMRIKIRKRNAGTLHSHSLARSAQLVALVVLECMIEHERAAGS